MTITSMAINLGVVALMFLFAARRRWFEHASDRELQRRESRRDFTVGLACCLLIGVAVPFASAQFRFPVLAYWAGIFIAGGSIELYAKYRKGRKPAGILSATSTQPAESFEVPSAVIKRLQLEEPGFCGRMLIERHRTRAAATIQCSEETAYELMLKIQSLRDRSDSKVFRISCGEGLIAIGQVLQAYRVLRYERDAQQQLLD